MSDHGRHKLIEWEGFASRSYRDAAGHETIGVGHLLTPAELDTGKIAIDGAEVAWRDGLSDHEVGRLLAQDLRRFEEAIGRSVDAALTQHQFDALVSLAFNIGVGAFTDSTVLRRINEQDFDAVPAAFRLFNKIDGGVVSEGLVKRRDREVALWNGVHDSEPSGQTGSARLGVVATPATPAPATPSSYTVAEADTLDSVARRFGITVAALAQANDIINPADFVAGRVVAIPAPAPVEIERGGSAAKLGVRDRVGNTMRRAADELKVRRQMLVPKVADGVDHREHTEHIRAVQQFGRDIGIDIAADGIGGPLTYGLTLSFQIGMIAGPYLDRPLVADAAPGPATTAMLDFSREIGFRCSRDFGWSEFATNNPDRTLSETNHVLRVDRDLVILTQRIRDHVGFGFSPLSAYRDPEWNEIVKGSLRSQHMVGKAIDIDAARLQLSEATVRSLGARGVGVVRATGLVAHVDTRDVPATWFYD